MKDTNNNQTTEQKTQQTQEQETQQKQKQETQQTQKQETQQTTEQETQQKQEITQTTQGSSDILKTLFAFNPNQPKVTNNEKLWGLLSYIPMLSIFALIINPTSKYVKLHARQGLILFIIFFFNIFTYIIPIIGIFFGFIIHLLIFLISIFSMYHAYIGNWWKTPILGDIAEMLPIDLFIQTTRNAIMTNKVNQEETEKLKKEQKNTQPQPTEQKNTQPPTPPQQTTTK